MQYSCAATCKPLNLIPGREGDITALAGYAGGKKAGPLERILPYIIWKHCMFFFPVSTIQTNEACRVF